MSIFNVDGLGAEVIPVIEGGGCESRSVVFRHEGDQSLETTLEYKWTMGRVLAGD